MKSSRRPVAVVQPSLRGNATSKQPITATQEPPTQKVSLHNCKFDKNNKCWLGPVKQDSQTSKWTRAKDVFGRLGFKSQKRKRNINVKFLVQATVSRRKLQALQGSMKMGSMGNEDDALSTRALSEKPVIAKPFNILQQNNTDCVWVVPRPLKQVKERSKDFQFEKPKPSNDKNSTSGAQSHHASYLKKVIHEKDKEIRTLQRQLMKANSENVKLIQELDGYRGKNYDEIFAENITLRENLQRVSRENAVLLGLTKQDDNRILQRILEKEQKDIITDGDVRNRFKRTLSSKPILQ